MHLIAIISLLFVQIYGAPTDLVIQPSDAVSVYEVTPPEQPIHYDIPESKPTNEYETKEEVTPLVYEPKETYEATTPLVYEAKEVYEAATPLPPSIDLIEETPNDVVIEKEGILDTGKHLSEAITAKIVGPIVIFNSKVAAAAGALPPMLAAKGAIIGSAIATPIEIGAVAGSSIVSGVTCKLVAVPISVVTGTVAKVVGAAEKGRQIWNFNVEHGGEILKDGAIRMGHIILKPIAVVVGAQTALTGAGLGMTGAGIKGVGVGIGAVGAKMVATGMAAKGLGTTLIKSQFVK